jgi:hypothetical protein
MGTALYLAVRNGLAPISDEEATHQYQLLRQVESAPAVPTLAENNALLCFDPPAGRAYLPPRLAAKQGDTAPSKTSSA